MGGDNLTPPKGEMPADFLIGLKGWNAPRFSTEQMSGVSRQRMLPLGCLTKQKSGVSRLPLARPPTEMKSAGPTPVLREGGDKRLRTPGWCPLNVF